jgi:PhzF family phenazine biosynthesis protein
MTRPFRQIDVFSPEPLGGNPLAVVLGGDGLSTEDMQRFTRWMNLSETAFVLPAESPEADYRVRIFTLAGELPFAGHPTLGTCHAWLEAGGQPQAGDQIIQECGIGLVHIRRASGLLWFAAPPLLRSGPVDEDDVRQLTEILGLHPDEIVEAQWVDNGPGWVGLLLPSAQHVIDVDAGASRFTGTGSLDVGLVGPYPEGSECAFEIRALFSDDQGHLREDPVTGSLNASVGQWLITTGRATPPFVTSQGTRLGRTGRPRIDRTDEGTVWVGGHTITLIQGEVDL